MRRARSCATGACGGGYSGGGRHRGSGHDEGPHRTAGFRSAAWPFSVACCATCPSSRTAIWSITTIPNAGRTPRTRRATPSGGRPRSSPTSASSALFAMMFGISIYLVGGERRDPARSAVLHRRLFWLAVFGLVHGTLIWRGDVLLNYAVVGSVVMLCRSWSPRRLLTVGLGICDGLPANARGVGEPLFFDRGATTPPRLPRAGAGDRRRDAGILGIVSLVAGGELHGVEELACQAGDRQPVDDRPDDADRARPVQTSACSPVASHAASIWRFSVPARWASSAWQRRRPPLSRRGTACRRLC